MDFHSLDSYLLTGSPGKSEVIDGLLREGHPAPAVAPYLRALQAVGSRAADEALIALRLVASGKALGDEAVRRMRALAALARAGASGDLAAAGAAMKKDRGALADLVPGEQIADAAALAALRAPAVAEYKKMLA